jgi:hypothetical protein
MKRLLATVAMLALAGPAFAQAPQSGVPTVVTGQPVPPYFTNAPVDQAPPPQGIPGWQYLQNTEQTGFGEHTESPLVTAAGTTQPTSTVLLAPVNIITVCGNGGTSGIQLPSLLRYNPIRVMNRCGYAIKVYPSPGGTVESAIGTMGAVNAAATVASNTDATFIPAVTATPTAGVVPPYTFSAAWYQ